MIINKDNLDVILCPAVIESFGFKRSAPADYTKVINGIVFIIRKNFDNYLLENRDYKYDVTTVKELQDSLDGFFDIKKAFIKEAVKEEYLINDSYVLDIEYLIYKTLRVFTSYNKYTHTIYFIYKGEQFTIYLKTFGTFKELRDDLKKIKQGKPNLKCIHNSKNNIC